jgi:hypothetical protein
MPNIQWRTPVDGQRKYPKHVDFLEKNKFEKISASLILLKKEILLCSRNETVKGEWLYR